jgi:hypothetical protein
VFPSSGVREKGVLFSWVRKKFPVLITGFSEEKSPNRLFDVSLNFLNVNRCFAINTNFILDLVHCFSFLGLPNTTPLHRLRLTPSNGPSWGNFPLLT